MKVLVLLTICASPFFSHIAHADQIYKCKADSGETIYQSNPCPAGSVTVAQGSYAHQPDDPSTQLAAAAEAAEANEQREFETRAAAAAYYNQPATKSAYAQQRDARNAHVEAGSYASRIGQRGRPKTQEEATAGVSNLRPARTSAPQFLAPASQGAVDQNGTYYAPAGPNGIVNTQSGQFLPKAGDGYIDTSTGQYVPAH